MTNLLYSNDCAGQYPDSWYAATAHHWPLQPSLQSSVECDVCVIGGGFTGLSAALHLAQRGYRVALLDAHRVGWGASGRNGGQLGSGQRLEQDELEHLLGVAHARRLWHLAQESKALVKDLIARYHIDCDLSSGILYTDHLARLSGDSREYVDKLQSEYGYSAISWVNRAELSTMLGTEAYHSAVMDSDAAHLHPLNYALGLARALAAAGVSIFENSPVTEIQPGRQTIVQSVNGNIKAQFVVLACNGYLGKLNAHVAARVMPINNFIVATEPLSEAVARQLIRDNIAVADSKFVVNYFRLSADRRLLFGGRESYGYRFPADIKSFVRRAMLSIYPQLQHTRIDYGWGGTLAITMRRMPYLQRLENNIFTASGYSGHGVGMATLSGQLIAEAIAGTAERFDVMSTVAAQRFPGGLAMRSPLLKLAMLYYSLRDKL